MSDLISRQAAIEAVGYYSLHSGDKLLFADKPLKELPSVQPERKRGKWKREVLGSTSGYGTTVMYQCSECERMSLSEYNFCPNCGSDNRGIKDGNDRL